MSEASGSFPSKDETVTALDAHPSPPSVYIVGVIPHHSIYKLSHSTFQQKHYWIDRKLTKYVPALESFFRPFFWTWDFILRWLSEPGLVYLFTEDYNVLNRLMFEPSKFVGGKGPIALEDRFNHLNEDGRSFAGSTNIVWEQYPRCITCRYSYNYRWTVAEGDYPRGTSLTANKPLYCAEPFGHYQCLSLDLRPDVKFRPEMPHPQPDLFDYYAPEKEDLRKMIQPPIMVVLRKLLPWLLLCIVVAWMMHTRR